VKLCAIIARGDILEISVVDDKHGFGDHDDHYHREVLVVTESVCPAGKPKERDEDDYRRPDSTTS